MSFFDDIFGSEETIKQEPMMPDWQLKLGEQTSEKIKKYLPKYEPGKDYSRLSEMMKPSQYEAMGLDKLEDYMNKGTPEALQAGAQEVLKTLGGDYDPYKSEYYEAMRKRISKQRKESLDQLNREAAKYGLNRSSWKTDRMAESEEETFDKVSELIAGLQENERVRKLQAVPQALNIAQFQELLPVNRIQAAMQYGGLPRELESVGYQDFSRKQNELSQMIGYALQQYGTNVPYGVKEMPYEKTGALSTLMPVVSDLAGGVGDYSLMKEMIPMALSAINPAAGVASAGASAGSQLPPYAQSMMAAGR